MDLRDAASKKMKLGEFLKENVCYCVYGEYTWNDCSVYDSQDSCHKISIIPRFFCLIPRSASLPLFQGSLQIRPA